MKFDFKDKVVLVTGAARGLGQHVAVAFAKAGAKVAITARDLDSLKETETKLQKVGVTFIKLKLDVTSYEDCDSAVNQTIEKLGHIDYLINNASAYLEGWDLREFSPQDIEDEINATLRGPIFMTKAVLDHFIKRSSGTIVNVASTSGLMYEGASSSVVYAADKAGVMRFSEIMHRHVSSYGVKVCSVAPCGIREDDLKQEVAVSYDDVTNVILMQCFSGDNLNMQTVVLEAGRS